MDCIVKIIIIKIKKKLLLFLPISPSKCKVNIALEIGLLKGMYAFSKSKLVHIKSAESPNSYVINNLQTYLKQISKSVT